MRPNFKPRLRGASLTVPPLPTSTDFSSSLAQLATQILYRSPLPSANRLPLYILDSASLPDANSINYDTLLPYILARFPGENELIEGKGYEIVFFAGGEESDSTTQRKAKPGLNWLIQVYQVLPRVLRKRLQRLYLVHEKKWIRVVSGVFSTIVSPKFRRKVVHVSSLSALSSHISISDLLIPPTAYSYDRRVSPQIYVANGSGNRAFGVTQPLPLSSSGVPRLPRVLREATSFILLEENVVVSGLFRVNARAQTLGILKEAYNRGQKFIVWKEGPVIQASSHWEEGIGEVTVNLDEIDDGYSLSTSAGLIKSWYSSLRQPIFPQSIYAFIGRVYGADGSGTKPLELPNMVDLLRQESNWSPLTKTSRLILTTHLLPLLAKVAKYSDQNQMTPRNLAVCFAPSLSRGTDPIEDARMAGTISRILEFAIEQWYSALAGVFGLSEAAFEASLRVPGSLPDREDPLDMTDLTVLPRDDQIEGVVLLDSESSDEETVDQTAEQTPEPLVSRSNIPDARDQTTTSSTSFKRKPVPPVRTTPRYAMEMFQSPGSDSPIPRLPELSFGDDFDNHSGRDSPRFRSPQRSPDAPMINRKPVGQHGP